MVHIVSESGVGARNQGVGVAKIEGASERKHGVSESKGVFASGSVTVEMRSEGGFVGRSTGCDGA